MAFTQVPQGGGGFVQMHPENQGFQQLHDSNNPQAQAYARMALARNGIHVPPGADAAAMWRQFSAQRASMQSQAASQGPDPYDPGVNPNHSLGTPQGNPGTYTPGAGAPTPPQIGPQQIGAMLPGGGQHPLGPDVVDWRQRIQQMAQTLNPGNTIHRAVNGASEFQRQQGGPAEQALAMRRIAAVQQAHTSARNLASLLSARKPSNTFRRTHDPKAY